MRDILLIRPRPDKETIGLQSVMICEPLELEYIVSNLKDTQYSTEILDMILEKKSLEFYIQKFKPKFVFISSYISHVNVVKKYCDIIKSVDPNIKTIVGGVHAEVVPEDFVHNTIDYIIIANGLATTKKLLTSIEKNVPKELIEGVYCGIKIEKETCFKYMPPDRDSVSKYRKHYYYMFHNPCALIKTSFGCPYQCKFCFCRKITDGKYFSRDMNDVIEELKTIPEKEIYIVDDDFLFNVNKLNEFCDLLEKNNIKKRYLVYGRADFIAKNEKIIERLARNGLKAVIVGLESSNEEELKKYNKKSDILLNEEAVKILQKYDIECYGTLILGIDWSKKDFDNLYKWIKKINIKFVNLQPFTPMPGTELFDEYKEKLIIPRTEYEKWDLAHLVVAPSKMSVRAFYYNTLKLYLKCILRPSNSFYIANKYGYFESLKLCFKSNTIVWQYLKKIIGGK